MEYVFGDAPPINPASGWVDHIPPEAEQVDTVSPSMPASVFKANTPKPIAVDVDIMSPENDDKKNTDSRFNSNAHHVQCPRVKVTSIRNRQKPTLTGQTREQVPIFRYEHLRNKARETIKNIQDIESRMLPIQFEMDDFAEITGVVRQNILEQKAELEAVKQKINELTQTLTALAEGEKEMDKIAVLLKDAVDECDCDWLCWLIAIAFGIFLGAIAVALILSIGAINPVVAASLILPILGGLFLADYYTVAPQLTCDNVGKIERQASTTLKGLRQAIQETQAELNFQISARDILIANIIAFTSELSELNESNQHRLLDATTLTNIQAQYQHDSPVPSHPCTYIVKARRGCV